MKTDENLICMGCNQIIEEDDWMIMSEHGPLGIFEPTEVGKLHNSCYQAMFEDEDDDEEDEDYEDCYEDIDEI